MMPKPAVHSIGLAALMLTATVPAGAGEAGDDPRLSKARAAVAELAEALKGQLMAAIKAGGPASAVGMCRTIAPELPRSISASRGLLVRRTALRLRNPANAPDSFERRVLEEFLATSKAGTPVATLEHSESVVDATGGRVLRYMKAITTAADPCLACHGSAIEPGVAAEIRKHYPEDQATGFAAGELRGAFSVTIPE